MKQRENLPILSTSRQAYSNASIGRSVSINSSSSSVHRAFLSSSCSNFVSPSHLSLKKIKPEPWQRLFQGKKQQELPTKKNSSNIDSLINEDFINLLNETSLFDENSHNSFIPAPLQSHIDHLYEQIDDLTSQLSEERFKHKQTRIKAGETLSNQLKNQENQFQQLLEKKLLDNQNQFKEQEMKYLKLIDEEQKLRREREEQLRDELEFVKNSFHTYKINLEKEHVEQNQNKTNEALVTLQQNPSEKEEEEEINKRINDVVIKERKHMSERQKIEIENIKKQYQNELLTIQKSFADSILDREHLESLNKELTSAKLELNETKEQAINLSTQLRELEMQHIKTITELNDYRMRYDGKNKDIEKLYTERVALV